MIRHDWGLIDLYIHLMDTWQPVFSFFLVFLSCSCFLFPLSYSDPFSPYRTCSETPSLVLPTFTYSWIFVACLRRRSLSSGEEADSFLFFFFVFGRCHCLGAVTS